MLRAAGHRILALNRGEREGWLRVSIEVEQEQALRILYRAVMRPGSACCDAVRAAAADALNRLILPSLEREIRSELTDRANEGAIRVFGENLRQLLMQPPVRGKVTLGVDPGFRTGCKLAVVDENGKVLDIEEKPKEPKSDTAVFATYLYKRDTVPMFREYLDGGNNPDAPGNFPAWLYKRKDVYAYTFSGECYDIGTPESYREVCRMYEK